MDSRLGERNNKHNHRFSLNVASKNITKKSKISSSRICVKNLPKVLTLDSVKDHFSRMGELTDAKLLRTREGTSRLVFIGYRTVEEAQKAIRYFNRSYLKNSRITCEVFGYLQVLSLKTPLEPKDSYDRPLLMGMRRRRPSFPGP